jgi:UDP-glucose 4-epimerase
MERAVVTGGAGFIGSHLVEALLAAGVQVMVIDDFSHGRRERLDCGRADGRLTVVEGDVRDAERMRQITEFAPCAVFHLAGLHFIPYCNAHPQQTLDVNVLGLDVVLRSLRTLPFKTFVFPSSGAVYGFGAEPWPETAAARPAEIYGITKWMGEHLVARFHTDRPNVRTVVARLFNTYGPRETTPHVLPEIARALREGRPAELGNLWPKRDLIFVTDTAAALVAAAAGGPGLETFNVGTGVGTTINDVIQVIEKITGTSMDVRQVPGRRRAGDGDLVCDPRKLMHATGWKPRFGLEAGLRRFLACEGLL